MSDCTIKGAVIKPTYNAEAFTLTITSSEPRPGIQLIAVRLDSRHGPALPELTLTWRFPGADIQGQWHPQARDTKHLMPPWNHWYPSGAAWNAPVLSLYNIAGLNRIAIALSDALVPSEFFCATRESLRSEFEMAARIKAEPGMETESFSFTLRVDTRPLNFARSLRDVATWWEELGNTPRPIPALAREPHYSAWYAFHDEVNHDDLLKEARLARELGCKVFLLDDGWQKDLQGKDIEEGDWTPKRIPDMRALSDAMHALDMRLAVWFATPFVRDTSKTFKRLGDCCFDKAGDSYCLDFRYPAARDHIAGILEKAVRDWNLDGLKLDFIDSVPREGRDSRPGDSRRDTPSRGEGVLRGLDTILGRVRAVQPDILVEFRQAYIGPLMRKYATAFRGFDCPQDLVNNRILTTDIRLLSAGTPAHSDMFIWSVDEPVEVAALQFANVLFSVPQVSVEIGKQPESHRKMLAFYIRFWVEHRDLLLDGDFTPLHPEGNYPALIAQNAKAWIGAVYNSLALELPAGKQRWTLVNATADGELVVKGSIGPCRAVARDCMGNVVSEESGWKCDGVAAIKIPRSGVWEAEAIG